MLDVARHFMPKDGVLRYLDLLAAHKLNVLPPPPDRRPGLAGRDQALPAADRGRRLAARAPNSGTAPRRCGTRRPHGGYYTQDDIREIVAYAAERHITVVPEIDIPGHSQAAIAAYPELGNTDVVDTAALGGLGHLGRSTRTCSPPPTTTLRFYEGVFEEVLELFPPAHRSSTSAATSAPRTSGGPPRPPRPASGSSGWPTRTSCSPGSSGTSTAGSPRAAAG